MKEHNEKKANFSMIIWMKVVCSKGTVEKKDRH